MTSKEVLKELKSYSDPQTKKTLVKHGAKEPFFGVKVADLKKIVKKVKKDYDLSKELFATGNSDAMYLAALIADEKKMTKKDLELWADQAYWYYLSEFAVPWVTAETDFGFELGMKWIKSKSASIAACGWATLSNTATVKEDENLDIEKYDKLLDLIVKTIHKSENRVRHCMNAFVIAVGGSIKDLTPKAFAVADKIGVVKVDMGGTSCKVPDARTYIQKIKDRGSLGKKRKGARC